MTGYGEASFQSDSLTVAIELRALNNRYLKVSLRANEPYNLLEPELSRTVLEEKLRNIQATGAKILVTGNPGCQMQIGAGAMLSGMDLTVCHPVELLDESYARAGMYEESDE